MTFCSVANEVNYPDGKGFLEDGAFGGVLTLLHPMFVGYSCKDYTLILHQECGFAVDRRLLRCVRGPG